MRKKHFATVMVLFLLSITWAPCQAEDNVIFACAKKDNGQLRVVSDPNQCNPSEYLISWPGLVQTFVGRLCWLAQKTEDEHGPRNDSALINMHITPRVGGYTVHAIMKDQDDPPFIFTGAAMVFENKVLITATSSQEHTEPWRDGGIVHMSLDTRTLNGTFWINTTSFNTETRKAEIDYSAGTLTLTTCP